MGTHTSFFLRSTIIIAVLLSGLVLGLWRQLHNGWVWYHFLGQSTETGYVTVISDYLLSDGLQPATEALSLLPDPFRPIVRPARQYGLVVAKEEITHILIRAPYALGKSIESELRQQGLHTARYAGFIIGQKEPIDKVSITKRLLVNIGKNYLSKRPLALAEIPAEKFQWTQPAIIIMEPYHAGIKTYIGLNKGEITKKEIAMASELEPLPQYADSLAMVSGDHLKLIPQSLTSGINSYLQQNLGFSHTEPDLLAVLSTSRSLAIVKSEAGLAIAAASASEGNSTIVKSLLEFLNKEEAYAHPVTRDFPLPSGRSGREVVPDTTQKYFTSPPSGCQNITGQAIHAILCQSDISTTIGTTQHLAQLAQQALRQSEVDWQFAIQHAELSRLPQLENWNHLSAYQKGQDIAFFLEK